MSRSNVTRFSPALPSRLAIGAGKGSLPNTLSIKDFIGHGVNKLTSVTSVVVTIATTVNGH